MPPGLVLKSSVLAVAMVSGLAGSTAGTTLEQLRDKSRPLLIFAGTAEEPRLNLQLEWIRQSADEARERDLVPVAVVEQGTSPTETSLKTSEVEAARRKFHIGAREFVVVLVGKDGGEKLRSSEPISFEQLRSAIDAMPMRQDEMSKRNKGRRSSL